MNASNAILIAALAWSIALATLWLALRTVPRWAADHPSHRSLHVHPRPRYGGLAMALAVVVVIAGHALLIDLNGATICLLASSIPVWAISFADDLVGVRASIRLAVHVLCAAAFALACNAATQFGIVGIALLVLALTWGMNLFNFMDGADGLAGGMAAIGFTTLAIAAALAGNAPDTVRVCAAIAGAAVAFLVFNFPPARVFMGDSGSISLGFLAGAVGVTGWRDGAWSAWFVVVVFSPFIVDASVTLARRAMRGARIWEPHREHLYQRMILAGWSHRRTTLAYYFVMLASSIYALLAQKVLHSWTVLVAPVLTYALLLLALERRLHQQEKDRTET